MTTYVAITNAQIDAESYIDTVLAAQWRDNTLAIQEGDSTAPKIQNKAIAGGVTLPFGLLNLGDESDGAISHTVTGNISSGIYQCTSFNIDAGVTMTVNTQGPLIILCTGTVTIPSTAVLIASGMGGAGGGGGTSGGGDKMGLPALDGSYEAIGGSGGGGGASQVSGAGGGTGGFAQRNIAGGAGGSGAGGNGSAGAAQVAAGEAYAKAWGAFPNIFGGAGGGGGAYSSSYTQNGGAGGAGGGLIIIVADTINFEGTITSNGNNGTDKTGQGSGGGGGGGGGVIITAAKTYTNDTGTRNVAGGSGGASNGGNGGAGGAGWEDSLTL